MKTSKIKKRYESSCNDLVKKFCKKQSLAFDYWVSDIVGDVACCGGYYFTMKDIIIDLDFKQPAQDIINWYEQNLEYSKWGIDYISYIRGVRVSQIIKQLN